MTAPAVQPMPLRFIGTRKHYTFHLVNGEAIDVDAHPDEVAFDGDYLTFDLPQGREVIIARRHITHIQVRDAGV